MRASLSAPADVKNLQRRRRFNDAHRAPPGRLYADLPAGGVAMFSDFV
jgi:hypothetical protein